MSSKASSSSSTARAAASALKSGVVLGGTAILSAVNGLTPHMAGAIDIMVVQQPNGSLKCSPFYVRFGKYTPMRSKDKRVQILINGEQAAFHMHLGAYGQAYFAAETMEIVSDADDEELLQGMMSPPSGYSSDEGAPYANEEMVSAVQQEVQRIKASQEAAAAAAVAAGGAANGGGVATGAGLGEQAAVEAAVLQGPLLSCVATDSGSESDTESSSSGLDDIGLTADEIAGPIRDGLAAGTAAAAGSSSAAAAAAAGLGTAAGRLPSSKRRSRQRHRRVPVVLHAPGDGAAEDPARAALQDMLLDNKYSFKVQSDESFTAAGLGPQQQQQQSKPHAKSRLQQQHNGLNSDPEQHHHQEQQQQQQEQRKPVRHVGFEVASPPEPNSSSSNSSSGGSGKPAAGDSTQEVHQAALAGVQHSAALASVGEESAFYVPAAQVATNGASDALVSSPARRPAPASADTVQQAGTPAALACSSSSSESLQELATMPDMGAQQPSGHGSVDAAAAAAGTTAAAAAMAAELRPLSPSRSRDGLLSTSLKAAQQQEQQQQADPVQEQQQQQRQQQQQASQGQPSSNSSSSSSSPAADAADASVILDGAAAPAPAAAQQQALRIAAGSPAPSAAGTAAADGLSSLQPSIPLRGAQQVTSAPAPADGVIGAAAAPTADGSAASPPAGSTVCAAQPMAVPTTNGFATVAGTNAGPAAGPVAAAAAGYAAAGPLAASPPAESGYLGDSEQGALGTSYDGGTPRAARLACTPGEVGASGSGPLALGLSGFQLSLCGGLLRADMAASEAQQVFETQRVSAAEWAERGVSLAADPDLVVKIGGSLYSWQAAAPMVVGMLAFGGKWDSLLGLDPSGIYPVKLAEDHSSTAKKSASSSWRLWPFTGWRDAAAASSSSISKQPPALGSSPPAGSITNANSSSTTANGLAPSGGSFSNLLSLMGPPAAAAAGAAGQLQDSSSSKLVRPSLDKHAPGSLSAPAAVGTVADGGSLCTDAAVGGSPPRVSRKKRHIIIIRKTLTPTSEQLSRLPLLPGSNTITFRASGAADLTAYIYLLRWNTRLVVSDVDGTITRSDLLGHVLPTLGVDWSHPGITQLFHNIDSNGYQIMFLSSRAIAQANITREYLHRLVQDGYKMPAGPVIISPHGLLPSLYREIVVRRPHEFKIACLQDIRALFPPEWNPFYAGFGNRDTDEVSYREVGVPQSRTFTINPKGQIHKAATPVQSSTWSSLSAINELVHELFPPLPVATSRSSSSRVMQQQLSSRRVSSDWDYAAAAGIVEQETLAAALAAQERQRGRGGSPAAAAGAAAAFADGAGNAPGSTLAQQEEARAAAAEDKPAAAAAAGAAGAVAAMQIVADATAAGSGGTVAVAAAAVAAVAAMPHAAVFEIEDVGPAREEFADLHYWRPSFSVDIGEELLRLERKQQQQQQQQQQQ